MSGAEGSGGSTEDRDSKISTFCSITGVEAERGQFYLESANWDIQVLNILTFHILLFLS